jgi:hypothetical protein
MTAAHDDPFSPATVAAIVRHMNEDHADDSLLICRHLGGQPDAVAARLRTLDPAGATFEVTIGDEARPVPVAWSGPVTARRQIREELVAMVDRALAAGGLPARASIDH